MYDSWLTGNQRYQVCKGEREKERERKKKQSSNQFKETEILDIMLRRSEPLRVITSPLLCWNLNTI